MVESDANINQSNRFEPSVSSSVENRALLPAVHFQAHFSDFAIEGSAMSNDIETRPMFDDEALLVEQLKMKDGEAWSKLLELYAADLRWDIISSLKKRNLSPEAAEDIEQETWTTAVRRIDGFTLQGPGKLYHWLRVIALNHVRTFGKHGESLSLDAFEEDDHDNQTTLDRFLYSIRSTDNTIEDEIELRQQLSILDHALRRLAPRDRELVLRRLIWGETPKQLAEAYPSRNPRSISQALLRAKKAIQASLSLIEPRDYE